jgi:glutathionylspermidine synthase
MERRRCQPRDDWRKIVESQGLTYAVDRFGSTAGQRYWDESAAYVFTEAEIDYLDETTERLHGMCLAAVQRMVTDPAILRSLNLPRECDELFRAALTVDDPQQWSLYGRLDLVWDGNGPAKLLEYNADTPTALVESAVCQWYWLEDLFPDRDQWNLVHERLVRTWQRMAPGVRGGTVHLAAGREEPDEDWATIAYLQDTATEAGLDTVMIAMEDVGWHDDAAAFVDEDDQEITTCFKLYPWDWMITEPFGRHLVDAARVDDPATTRWIEPVWKLLMGSKALLSTLWELYPGDENLLPAHLGNPSGLSDFVAKPMFGWEGAGIQVVTSGTRHVQPVGNTAGQTLVYQQYHPVPDFDGNHPILGTWVVGGRPAGLGIRESTGPVTDTNARFVPHLIDTPRADQATIEGWLAD